MLQVELTKNNWRYSHKSATGAAFCAKNALFFILDIVTF